MAQVSKKNGYPPERVELHYGEASYNYKLCTRLQMKAKCAMSWMSDPLNFFLEVTERSNDKYHKVKSAKSKQQISEKGSDGEGIIGALFLHNHRSDLKGGVVTKMLDLKKIKSAMPSSRPETELKLMPCHILKRNVTLDMNDKPPKGQSLDLT